MRISKSTMEMKTLEQRDQALEQAWAAFGDIPMNPDTECIEEPFLQFPIGTNREDIWHWFDSRYSKGVAYLLYSGAEDYVPETRRLYSLKKLCSKCESRDCAFNSNGSCRFPMVYERAPAMTDENDCMEYVIGGRKPDRDAIYKAVYGVYRIFDLDASRHAAQMQYLVDLIYRDIQCHPCCASILGSKDTKFYLTQMALQHLGMAQTTDSTEGESDGI